MSATQPSKDHVKSEHTKTEELMAGALVKGLPPRVRCLFPKLTPGLRKGDCGRMAVIGGAVEYTGAPYFSAMTQMRMGADLSYVFCHPQAAPVIKSYSPELIVYPSYDTEGEDSMLLQNLPKFNAVVVGPGLGRNRETGLPLMRALMKYAMEKPNLGVVVDADALLYLPECLPQRESTGGKTNESQANGHRFNNVVLTPNLVEFARLCERVLPNESTSAVLKEISASNAAGSNDDGDLKVIAKKAKRVAASLGMCIMVKGRAEVITNGGNDVYYGDLDGCPRRCGGLGDILGGATALLIYWASLRQTAEGTSPEGRRPNYTGQMLVEGSLAASDFVRLVSRHAFSLLGRSTNAADVVAHIQELVKGI